MIKLKINNQEIEVPKGTLLIEAASELGIHIPTMCWAKKLKPSTSCMVCVVEDKSNGKIVPACSFPALSGIEIETENQRVKKLRKSALELLLSEHTGDCVAPCQRACPAGMDIPLMNRLIAKGDYKKALEIVKETIALPAILGYICSAPCEKACRRKDIDQAVSICVLKRFVAEHNLDFIPEIKEKTGKKIAIIGTGVMGLSAAYYLLLQGHSCVIFDKNEEFGGSVRYEIPELELPQKVIDNEIEIIREMGAEFRLDSEITAKNIETELLSDFDAIIIATGKSDFEFKSENKNTIQGFYYTEIENCLILGVEKKKSRNKMAVRSVAQGKTLADYTMQYFAENKIEPSARIFNSTFGKLLPEEHAEFLKEAENKGKRTETENHLTGFTEEQAVAEAKRCLRCDCRKPDNCKLRDLSTEYNAKQRTYQLTERILTQKSVQHDYVVFEPAKCIKCGICIQITEKSGEQFGFTFIGRGFDVRVGFPLNQILSESLQKVAEEVAEKCPTGAISRKS